MQRRALLLVSALAAFPRRLRAVSASARPKSPAWREAILRIEAPGNRVYSVTRPTPDGRSTLLCTEQGTERWRQYLPLTEVRALGIRRSGAIFVTGAYETPSGLFLIEYAPAGLPLEYRHL